MTKRKRKKTNRSRYILISFVIIIVITGAISTKIYIDKKREKQDIINGYSVLKDLEKKDVNLVEREVFASNDKQANEVKKDKVKKDSTLSNEEYFKNSIFMGDSITEAMGFFKIVNPSQVVAVKGQNVMTAKNNINKIQEKNPTELFMLYGMNDLEIFKNPEDFIKEYSALISSIKEVAPNTQIYVESILPTSSKVSKKDLSRQRIDTFNDALNTMCKNLNINFINIISTIDGKNELYEPDGIHPKATYYKELLNYIKNTI